MGVLSHGLINKRLLFDRYLFASIFRPDRQFWRAGVIISRKTKPSDGQPTLPAFVSHAFGLTHGVVSQNTPLWSHNSPWTGNLMAAERTRVAGTATSERVARRIVGSASRDNDVRSPQLNTGGKRCRGVMQAEQQSIKLKP
jgi:hypothetical protein